MQRVGKCALLGYHVIIMKLKSILESHHQFNKGNALPDNLGDGYLINHNLIFRNIRTAALKLGVKFTSKRFHEYDVLPLTQLPKILATNTVPYMPNVAALEEIENAVPGHFELNDTPPLKANYVLHETAHCVAHQLRLRFWKDPSGKSIEAQKEIAWLILFEEAFANASDSLMNSFSDTKIQDDFLMRNTYIYERPNARKNMKTAIKLIGLGGTFKLILISFLYANFQKSKIAFPEFRRIMLVSTHQDLELIDSLNVKDVNLLRQVFQGGLDLDPMFTVRTNGFCLQMMGVTANPKNLYSYDFLSRLEKEPKLVECLEQMAKTLSTGLTT